VGMRARSGLVALALVSLATPPALAQTVWVSGAVQRDVQRFPEDEAPNRLDGAATGWSVGATLRMLTHLVLAAEWSDAGTIDDVRTTPLSVDGRTIAITSTFRHETTTLTTLAGYRHTLFSRVGVAYLGGVAFTRVRREFLSNAPGLVLVSPSDLTTSSRSDLADRFHDLTGGVDAVVRIKGRVYAVTGIRAQKIRLLPDISGWSLRTFIGAGWAF
jgi:hypothetical protein